MSRSMKKYIQSVTITILSKLCLICCWITRVFCDMVVVKGDDSMSIFDELYYGNINISERAVANG